MKSFLLFTLSLAALATPGIIYSQNNSPQQQCSFSGIDYQHAIALEKILRLAVKNNDAKQFAQLAQYPLTIYTPVKSSKTSANKKLIIKNQQQLLRQYPKIMTHSFKAKILKQTPGNIFCNWQGAMLYGGSFWFKGKPLRIFVINQPELSQTAE